MSLSSLTYPMRLLGEDEKDPPHFSRKTRYDLNSKLMLTAIISLSVVVLLVIVLHTYARCVLRRQAIHRNSLRRHLGSTVAAHTVQSSSEPPKTGLLPSVIASLPIFVFTKVEGGQDEATSTECAVCLSNLEEEEMARLLPNCNHTFHAECIDTWLNSHTTCPICRTEAEPRLQPEPREGPAPPPTASAPTAPPLERVSSVLSVSRMEGTSDAQSSSSNNKVMTNNGSVSRLSSFRRMLSMDRSSRRVQSSGQEDGIADQDLERQ